jgi:hypothetical protein
MNNTKTKTLSAIAVILITAALVVGGTLAAMTPSTAFAFKKKPGHDDNKKGARDNGNSRNGNTITIQKCKQKAYQSGWDNTQEQECGNTICTHPGANATCVSEQEQAVTPVTPPVTPPNIEECTAQDPSFDNDITMAETVSNSVTLTAGDVICIQGLGNHPAFDLTTGTAIGTVLVSEGQCTGISTHEGQATLTSPPDARLGNTVVGGTLCVGFA